MENSNEEHLNLIVKHLRGETSAFEENLLQEWLNENERHKETYQETVYLWNAGKASLAPVPDVDNAWQKVKERTQIGMNQSEAFAPKGKVRSLYDAWSLAKIAASILFFLVVGYLTKTLFFTEEEMIRVTSGNEKKEMYLPDSSRIWLNKNTTLSYSENYNSTERNVYLEGEAFFEVRKNKEKPFTVHGKLSKTRVLGTSFNVRSVSTENADEVKVVEGKVSFVPADAKEEAKVILLAGDMASLKKDGKIEQSKIQEDNFLAWQNDKLAFDNTPLKLVVADLESYFEVPVIIQDAELYSCKFTGTFSKPQMEEIMKVLAVSINLSYSKKDNAYLLTGKGCE